MVDTDTHVVVVPDAPPEEDERRTQPRLVDLWPQLARTVGVYGASRLVVFVSMVVGTVVNDRMPISASFQYWDAGWWMGLINGGYPQRLVEQDGQAVQSSIAFFPGFPLLVRAVSTVTTMGTLVAAVVVSLVLGAVATVLLWLLTRRLVSEVVANRVVPLFCFFPASWVFGLPYSEGAMLAFGIGSVYAAVSRKWVLAGALAAVATATRPTAIAIVPALAWAAFVAVRQRGEWRAVVAPLLAPLGIVSYFVFLWRRTGEPLAWVRVQQEGWKQADDALHAYKRMWELFTTDPLSDLNGFVCLFATAFLAYGIYALARWRPRPPGLLVAYTAGVTFLVLTSGIGSRPRYELTIFPIFMAIAWRLRATAYAALVGSFASLLGVYTLMSTTTRLAIP